MEKAPEAAAYNPDFKFKANNKEHEIPEMLRAVIKDAKSEEFVKKIFAKAYGLDAVKERYGSVREELQQVRQAHSSVMEQVSEARTAYQRGDMDTVFDTLRISPEKVLQWAVEKVQLSQMPPEQRQMLEGQKQAERQAYLQQKQMEQYGEQTMQQQAQYLSQMLELVLERPDYSAAAQAYDSRKNSPGAFRDLVIRVGESEHALTGKVLTPMEAAQKALEWLGETPRSATAPMAQPPAAATPATQTPEKKTLPNLANAGARNNSAPAKSKMKSLDDLKRAYDQKYAPNQ